MSGRPENWWNDDEAVTPLEARRRLGRYLYDLTEQFDPSYPSVEWADLPDDDRSYYIDLIAYLMDRRGLIEKALSGADLLRHSFEVHRT